MANIFLTAHTDTKKAILQTGITEETHTESVITSYKTTTVEVGPPSYTIVYNSDGTTSYIQDNAYDLASNFSAISTGTVRISNPTAGNGMKCDFGFYGATSWTWKNQMQTNNSGVTFSGKIVNSYNEMAVSMDFDLEGVDEISDLDGEGFSILCGGCTQYINITFDFEKNNSESTYGAALGSKNSSNMEYTIGIKDLAELNSTALSEAIFNGVRYAHTTANAYTSSDTYIVESDNSKTPVSTYLDWRHDLRVALNPNYNENKSSNGTKYVFLKLNSPAMDFISKGTVLTVGKNTEGLTGSTTISVEQPTTITITEPVYTTQTVTETIPIYEEVTTGIPLYIHHGTEANQATAVLFKDMHTKSLKGTIPNDTDKERLNSLSQSSDEYYEFQKNTFKSG